jgi:molecular chaperone DnaJ
MTPKEAYNLLDVPSEISGDDLKKKYKELCFKYHPDKYKKDPDKFKKINEAYQLITDYRQNPQKYEPKNPGVWANVPDIAQDFFINLGFENEWSQPSAPPPQIRILVELSFHESVMGCTKDITYKRLNKCKTCDGTGLKKTGNGCDGCDGFGRVTTNSRGVIFQSVCTKCSGRDVAQNKCEECNGNRYIEETRTGTVNIPQGSKSGDTLRLLREGNFVGKSFFGDSYTDVFINVKVTPHTTMRLEESNVYSNCKITLLEALEGTSKEIETVYGVKKITIKSGSRHSDQIKIPNCGVKSKNGWHIVQLDVQYPEDLNVLIGVLKDGIHNSV